MSLFPDTHFPEGEVRMIPLTDIVNRYRKPLWVLVQHLVFCAFNFYFYIITFPVQLNPCHY